MALTVIQIFNKVLRKVGLIGTTAQELSALTSLTADQMRNWDLLVEAYQDLSSLTEWFPLRTQATITLISGTNSYALESDFNGEDPTSFKYNNEHTIEQATPQEVDALRNDRTLTGYPTRYYREGNNIKFDYVPGAAENGKTVVYYYFKMPTALSTSSPSATTWIPSPYEETVLLNKTVKRIFESRERQQATIYAKLENENLLKMLMRYEDPCMSQVRMKYDGGHGVRASLNEVGEYSQDYGMR